MLVEGTSKKSEDAYQGRTDTNKTVVFPVAGSAVECGPGDYVIVQVESVQASTLQARAVERTKLQHAEARIAELKQQQQEEEARLSA